MTLILIALLLVARTTRFSIVPKAMLLGTRIRVFLTTSIEFAMAMLRRGVDPLSNRRALSSCLRKMLLDKFLTYRR